MNNFSISFERPLFLLLLLPAFLLILLPFLRFPKNRRRSVKRIAPVVLHLLITLLLVLVIAGVSVITKSSKQTVMILMDISGSMDQVSDEVEEKTQELLIDLPKDAQVGVLAFGESETLLIDPKSNQRTLSSVPTGGTGSDIASVLEEASSFFSDDYAARMILLSDGEETNSKAESMASYLATNGVEVDVMYFDTAAGSKEMQINQVSTVSSCYLGDQIELTVEVESNYEEEIVLTLLDNGEMIQETPVEVQKGTNLYTLSTIAKASGIRAYSVELTNMQDTLSENNQGYAAVKVYGAPSILLVAEKISDTELLGTLLTSLGNEVTTVTTSNMPKSIIELCNFDEIILLNVDALDLPKKEDQLLDSYVSLYGRTLLAIGGKNTFQYGSMTDTAFVDFLPTVMELKESEEGNSVALMLVLDCSMSMSNGSTNLTLAKQGAVNVVESMSDNDYIGIISFNRTAVLQAELTRGTESNKDALTRVVSQLTTSQGTYYTQALQLAYEELLKSDADTRHVIFLSDGNPNDQGYNEVVQQMADAGITVSSIGLGYTSSTLENMATIGSGRYYYVSSTKDLPDIMLSETEQVVVNAIIENETSVQIAKNEEVLEGVTDEMIPTLSGYIGLTEKQDATVLLKTEDDRPILTSWQYGHGTVTVFAGDLTGSWSENWYNSSVGQYLISQICTGFVDLEEAESSMMAEVKVEGTNVSFTVTTAEKEEGDSVLATVMTSAGEMNLELLSNGKGTYSATINVAESGIHSLVFLQKNAADENVDYYMTSFSINYSSEYDEFRDDGETVLMHLAELTGGIVSQDVKTLATKKPNEIYISQNPLALLSILILVMLIVDIAIRKLRLKDIKRVLGIH